MMRGMTMGAILHKGAFLYPHHSVVLGTHLHGNGGFRSAGGQDGL